MRARVLAAMSAVIGLGALALLVPDEVRAQNAGYSEAFVARVASPGDTGTLGRFIAVAVREGQYDQAISTTEQHLIDHPRDAKARLIAGRLYNHIGSYELARRQLQHALSIGTLSAAETAEAEDLLRRVQKALNGWTGHLALTGGVRSEWIDFDNGTDRDDIAPFGVITGLLRQDLKTATRDALIYSGTVMATRRFFDTDLSQTAGENDFLRGRGSVTWDKGLPNFGIETLRMLLSAYVRGESFSSSTQENEVGTALRFTARPTVSSFVFVGASYGYLGGSKGIFTDERLRWEAGMSQRLTGSWAIGVSVQGSHDYGDAVSGEIGRSLEGEITIGGVVYTIPERLVWTHQVGVGFGERETPDLSVGPGTVIDSDFWRLTSQHDFQIGEKQYVSLDVTYTETDYDSFTAIDRDSIEAVLSYTHIFD